MSTKADVEWTENWAQMLFDNFESFSWKCLQKNEKTLKTQTPGA